MKRLFFIVVLIVTISLFMGCSTTRKSISFKESNAYFLKENIEQIDIGQLTNYIDENDNIVLVSTEVEDTHDNTINSTIEDVLIKKLIENNYSVLERDNDLIYRLLSESDTSYTHYLKTKRISQSNSSSLGMSDSYFSNFKFSSSASQNSMYASGANSQEKENFDQMSINTNLLTADKILAYRVIENGIIYENANNIDPSIPDITRTATTLLSFRITDAKSGKIISMVDVDQSSSDQISKKDQDLLEKYHYRNYSFSYPNIYGNPKQVVHRKDKATTPSRNSLLIFTGVAIMTGITIAISM